jgi:hypothetical protein
MTSLLTGHRHRKNTRWLLGFKLRKKFLLCVERTFEPKQREREKERRLTEGQIRSFKPTVARQNWKRIYRQVNR